ncbi:MAG: O-antigen ligase family protein, partial [Elusimicrobiota bacterium]
MGPALLTPALSLFCLALPLSIAGANIGWALVLAAMFYRLRQGKPPAWSAARGALEIPLWAYFAAAVLTALLGLDPARSFRSINQEAHKVWLYYLLSIALASSSSRLPSGALAAGFALASLTGIAQALTGALSGAPVRAHAFVHPVTFGEQAAVGLLGAFCFLLSPSPETSSGRPRRLLWGLAALLGAGLLLSSTRGAALGAAAGALAVLWLAPHWRRWSAAALLACALAFVAMDLSHWDRSILNEALTKSSVERPQLMRLTFWKVALRMGLDHPWTGV